MPNLCYYFSSLSVTKAALMQYTFVDFIYFHLSLHQFIKLLLLGNNIQIQYNIWLIVLQFSLFPKPFWYGTFTFLSLCSFGHQIHQLISGETNRFLSHYLVYSSFRYKIKLLVLNVLVLLCIAFLKFLSVLHIQINLIIDHLNLKRQCQHLSSIVQWQWE